VNLLDATAPDLWQIVRGRSDAGGMIRQARASTCPTCGGWRIHGLDADMAALPAMCDPEPLSALGEAQATILGLRTYDLSRCGAGYQLDGRDHFHVKGRPAGSGVVDVLAEHRCGAALDRASPVLQLRRPSTDTVPPF
jgi:hypothetical protein